MKKILIMAGVSSSMLIVLFIYNKNSFTQSLNIITPISSMNTPAQNITNLNDKTTAAITEINGTYLKMSEIGVKITLSDGVRDIVYAPFEINYKDKSAKAFGISSQSLLKNNTKFGCKASNGALGVIVATNGPEYTTNLGDEAYLTPDGETIFELNNIYYQYIPPQDIGCESSALSKDEISIMQKTFQQDFATIQLNK